MKLNKKEQKIYELLKVKATSQDKDGHFCIYPVKELAMDCNINSRTVMRALKELEQNGYILRKRQDDHQTQRIYLLKNVTCSTVSGKNVTCSTVSGKNVTCSTMGGENVTCSTVGGENVTCSTMSEENVTCSTMGGENVPSTRCGENVTCSTMGGENVTCSTVGGENVTCSTMGEENVTCSTLSVDENVPCSTLSDENVPCSTLSGENVHTHTSTLSGENVTCSTLSEENVHTSTLSGENVRHSIVDTEKMSPSTQSVAENDTPSTECTAITKSQKKPFLPHLELSAITAERMFYTMPTSPASHFLFDILAAAEDIANIPKRKKHVNHGTKYEVKASGNKRQVSMENYQGTAKVTVELADINILNKAGKKLLILSMIKANEQSLHNGELTRDYISFPLQELVDYGLYSRLSGARKGFAIGTDALTSIKIKGTIRKTKKSTATIQALEVPFTGAKIENNQCFIYLNNRIDWKFLAQYFTKIPKYYFKLSNRASDLLYYIFYLARQHTNEIAERGYFTVRFWAIHSLLQLPDPSTARNPQRDIKEVIENAITEIETEHNTTYGNKELSFALVYSEQAGISEYLDNGYLKVSLSGAFAEFFIEQSHTRESKIDREEKKQARIEEKAKAINIARSMENGKPNHTQDGNN